MDCLLYTSGGVADGLRADLLVALLMVADVVDVVGLFLAVLLAGEDAADVGLALGAGAKACLLYTSRCV